MEQHGIRLDALPYIDYEYSDVDRVAIDALISAEMQTFQPPDAGYLAYLPKPDLNLSNTLFSEHELARIASFKAQTPFDVSRYKVEPPSDNKKNDLEAWHEAINNARAQLEHREARLSNLELLKKFGPNAWKTYNSELEAQQKRLALIHEQAKKDIEAVNRKRKSEQTTAGPLLYNLEKQWYNLVGKNTEIELACFQLEQEIKRLRAHATKQGLLKEEQQPNGHTDSSTIGDMAADT